MKNLGFILFTIGFILLSACSSNQSDSGESLGYTLPVVTEIEKPPISMEFYNAHHLDNYIDLFFVINHIDGNMIKLDDYQFRWPKYITDQEGVIYEVTDVDVSPNSIHDRELDNHELGITLRLSPPPASNDQLVSIPFYMIPRIFETGYPFELTETSIDQIEIGDLIIENIEVNETTLSFLLIDDHPQQDRNISYLFTRLQDEQEIFPQFTRVHVNGDRLQVELDFAQDIVLPSHFSIERTTVNIPEWRFSFSVPLKETTDPQE